MSREVGSLVSAVLRLEAERVVALAEQQAGLPRLQQLVDLDDQLSVILDGLERRGVAYPGHVVGARYGLSGGEYLMLLVALMPHHAPDLCEALREALDGPDEEARRSYVLWLMSPDPSGWGELDEELEESDLLSRGLVIGRSLPDGDERLVVSLALLELYGLA